MVTEVPLPGRQMSGEIESGLDFGNQVTVQVRHEESGSGPVVTANNYGESFP